MSWRRVVVVGREGRGVVGIIDKYITARRPRGDTITLRKKTHTSHIHHSFNRLKMARLITAFLALTLAFVPCRTDAADELTSETFDRLVNSGKLVVTCSLLQIEHVCCSNCSAMRVLELYLGYTYARNCYYIHLCIGSCYTV